MGRDLRKGKGCERHDLRAAAKAGGDRVAEAGQQGWTDGPVPVVPHHSGGLHHARLAVNEESGHREGACRMSGLDEVRTVRAAAGARARPGAGAHGRVHLLPAVTGCEVGEVKDCGSRCGLIGWDVVLTAMQARLDPLFERPSCSATPP